jgi:hypothetical protein
VESDSPRGSLVLTPIFLRDKLGLLCNGVETPTQDSALWGGSNELEFNETRGGQWGLPPPRMLFWASVSHGVGVKYRGHHVAGRRWLMTLQEASQKQKEPWQG